MGLSVWKSLGEGIGQGSLGGLVEGPECWVGTYNMTRTTTVTKAESALLSDQDPRLWVDPQPG